MLGHKDRAFRQHIAISVEDLVPQDNFYRQVDQCIYLSFGRELAAGFYPSLGRLSIDPVVLFRLQLLAFFEGIRSERQLMETVNLNLAHRWFIFNSLLDCTTHPASSRLPRLLIFTARNWSWRREGLALVLLSSTYPSTLSYLQWRDRFRFDDLIG